MRLPACWFQQVHHIHTSHRHRNKTLPGLKSFFSSPAAAHTCFLSVAAYALTFVLFFSLAGCSSRPLRFSSLLKTTIDMVAEDNANTMNVLMEELLLKLYRRNPSELSKVPDTTIEMRRAALFGENPQEAFAELDHKRSIDAMLLSFEEHYTGDRVFALVAGLRDMIWSSYKKKNQFYFYDMLEPQQLYDSARNIEILIWRLNHRLNKNGCVFLLTNEISSTETNLSFERLFGKMIVLQDQLATTIADRTNRTFVTVSYRLASAAFIPIGM